MAGANVFKIPVLKIQVGDKILLNSRNAKQEIYPVSKEILRRNINSELVKTASLMKLKTIIETNGDINIDALKTSVEDKETCKIYSMVRFCSNVSPIPESYVEDSLEKEGDTVTYRPILDVILTNFTCKATNDGEHAWKLEFEEI